MIKKELNDFSASMGRGDSLWHDYNLDVSSKLLEEFSKNDWMELKKIALSYPQYWQERCAEAIGYMDNENGIELLVCFLNSSYFSVSAIAATELDNMLISLPKYFESRLMEILEYLQKKQSPRFDDVQKLITRLA